MSAELVQAVAAARAAYLEVERVAARSFDDELDGRVCCARLALLDVADCAAQLLNAELAEQLELELDRYGVDEAA